MSIHAKESPTLTQKLCAILRQPWNRELREESLSAETIERLRAAPVTVEKRPDRERGARWSEDYRDQEEQLPA